MFEKELDVRAGIAGFKWGQTHKGASDDDARIAFNLGWIPGTGLEQDPPEEYWRNSCMDHWLRWFKIAAGRPDPADWCYVYEIASIDMVVREVQCDTAADYERRHNSARRLVQADISAGRLPRRLIGNVYVVPAQSIYKWLNNPRKGSRTK